MSDRLNTVRSHLKAWRVISKHIMDEHPSITRFFGDKLEVKDGIVTFHICQICGKDLLPLYDEVKIPVQKTRDKRSDSPEHTSKDKDGKRVGCKV